MFTINHFKLEKIPLQHLRKSDGYSLIELLCVIALISFLGIGLSQYCHSLEIWRLRLAGEAIVNDIRLAQSLAQASGQNIDYIFYQDRTRMTYAGSMGKPVQPDHLLPQGIFIDVFGNPSLSFTSLGGVSSVIGNAWNIPIQCGRERIFIVVAVNSGRISLRSIPTID